MASQPIEQVKEEVDYESLPPTQSSIPLVAAAIPLCAAQLLGTRHMRGQVMRLLRDPHVWLPWNNKNPWKNPLNSWWTNKNPWENAAPWKNNNPWHPVTGQAKSLSRDIMNRFGTSNNATWKNAQPWKNPSPWKAPPKGGMNA